MHSVAGEGIQRLIAGEEDSLFVGTKWARPNVDEMLGVMRLVLACSPHTRRVCMHGAHRIRIALSDTLKHSVLRFVKFLWT